MRKPASLQAEGMEATEKSVVAIRHAESEFNAALGGDNSKRFLDSMKELVDCGITEKGFQKSKSLSGTVKADFVVISPLKRAIETAMLMFPGIVSGDIPHILQPLAAEQLLDTCDIGTRRQEIITQYPWVDTSLLPSECWWYSGRSLEEIWDDGLQIPPFESDEHFDSRVSQLRKYAFSLPHNNVVVVCHSHVIYSLTQYEKEGEIFGQWVDNNACVNICDEKPAK
eukprot:TRINITY_DN5117_c0_g1_i1.p1 TRINITY_DN5117_c0_g1~~TRINITY_DN5117_c0_g1_i1.p1  ORF type:complete len:226 (+),score=47.06 TRINITY_DN5117_c0_g1_i1:73-750(+)